jgi:16S rRNA (guanine527-N7)-methyltransferase
MRHSAQLFNLTAILDPNEAWNRHVVESLRLVPLLGVGKRLIDIGSGGGLPGLVLAIPKYPRRSGEPKRNPL